MICPACHNVMIVVEQEKIELDYCANCSGVWFDSGELELMVEVMGQEGSGLPLTNLLSSPEAETSEKKRKCPICNQKMKKTTIGHKPAVLIDMCRHGHGLWFDGGEVHELIKQYVKRPVSGSDSQERILTFLGDTFQAEDQSSEGK